MQRRVFSLLLIAFVLFSVAGWAQATRGTSSGRVTDPSSAVVPGAQVVVTNTAMGTKSNLTTNAEGIFRAPLLPPGIYSDEISAPGFKKAMRGDIELRIADRLE